VTASGILSVAGVECAKLRAQVKVRAVLAVCLAAPFLFVAAMRVQNGLPEDTLFGRYVKDSGFATPLVVLGFAALWVFPVLTGIVGGDLFSAEDRYGTWTILLTRSCSRSEVFAGKVGTALGFSLLTICVLAAGSLAAGTLGIGHQPLIDLSGAELSPARALRIVALAWASVLPPALGFTGLAVAVSVATRSSAAGIGLPVLAGLAMQLCSFVDGPEWIRRLLITSGFTAWHGILHEHPYYRPLIDGTAVSLVYLIVSLGLAYRILLRRDIGR
jgi:ABC-2 type transport system permease protein